MMQRMANVNDDEHKEGKEAAHRNIPDDTQSTIPSTAEDFRKLFKAKKSLSFIKAKNKKGDYKRISGIMLNTLSKPCCIGSTDLHVPPLICDLIVYIEGNGLRTEGLYRVPDGMKPKYSVMFEQLENHGPECFDIRSASLLVRKLLKVIKSPLIPSENQITMLKLLEDWDKGAIQDLILSMKRIVSNINPKSSADTLTLLCVHLSHVLKESAFNKTEVGHLVASFSQVLRVKDKLLKFLIINAAEIFPQIDFTKYRRNSWQSLKEESLNTENLEELEKQLAHKESILTALLEEVGRETNKDKDELLWTVQREITQIKRKIKQLVRNSDCRVVPKFQAEISRTVEKIKNIDASVFGSPPHEKCEPCIPVSIKDPSLDQLDAKEKYFKGILKEYFLIDSLREVASQVDDQLKEIQRLESLPDARTERTFASIDENIVSTLTNVIRDNDFLEAKIDAIKRNINIECKRLNDIKVEMEWKECKEKLGIAVS